jgi:tetratricopeptide (TPR) repeat protein
MRRLALALAALWVIELAGGALLLAWRQPGMPRPPTPDWTCIEPLAAEEFAAQRAGCKSAGEWRRLGETLMAYGYFREAEACLRTAAARAEEDAEGVFLWAYSLELLGLLDEANVQYERAARLGANRAPACRYFMARNRLRQERPEAAAALLAQAGRLPAARYERARLLARSDPRAALPMVEELIAEYPQALQPRYLRYRIARLTGSEERPDLADAAALSRERLPNPFSGLFDRLTRAHQGMGARRVVGKARLTSGSLAPREVELNDVYRRYWLPGAADMLAKAHSQRREWGEARRLLQEVLDRDGPSAHSLYWLGVVHEHSGDRTEAERLWEQALPLGTPAELKGLHDGLARICENSGRKEKADRHRAAAHFAAGVESFWSGDLSKARQGLRRAVEQDPGHDAAWFYLGETHRQLRQPAEARAAYERALKLRPEHGRAARGLKLAK